MQRIHETMDERASSPARSVAHPAWTLASAALLAIAASAGLARAQQTVAKDPQDGRAVLERMHAKYDGHWYSSMAFVQKTTTVRPDGARDSATWYESLKGPSLLRIDIGSPAQGNGVIFTADSTWVFRNGALARAAAEGNPFLPVIMGVYLQPVDRTVRELAHHGVDVSKFYRGTWQEQPVFVVGASATADSTSPQFWVDPKRLVAVRMLLPASPGQPTMDITWMTGSPYLTPCSGSPSPCPLAAHHGSWRSTWSGARAWISLTRCLIGSS